MLLRPTFNKHYLLLAILLFAIEVLIAIYAYDAIIRPYFGDFLVVILIYWFVKTCFNSPVLATGVVVLLFYYIIQALQYFAAGKIVGFTKQYPRRTIIGTSFE